MKIPLVLRISAASIGLSAAASCADLVGADFEKDGPPPKVRRDAGSDVTLNAPPTAAPVELTVIEGSINNQGQLRGSDAEGGALTYRIVAPPQHGKVSLVPETGAFTYASRFTAEGVSPPTDSFTYQVQDPGELDAPSVGTVTITVHEAGPQRVMPTAELVIPNSRMGTNIDIDGDTALLGAERYGFYVARQQPDRTWRLVQAIPAPDGASNSYEAYFGWSVALSGEWALVGAPGDWNKDVDEHPDEHATLRGRAHFYRRDAQGKYVHVQQVTAPGEGSEPDYFGWDVSIQGTRAIITAHRNGAGTVYELTFDGRAWSHTQTLRASDGETFDYFGYDAALDGDTLAVIANGRDDPKLDGGAAGTNVGAVYVFERGAQWTEVARLDPVGASLADKELKSVALSGRTLLVGSPQLPDAAAVAANDTGRVYLFRRGTQGWDEPAAAWDAPEHADTKFFGRRVALQGDTAVVTAASRTEEHKGRAYVFRRTPEGWPLSGRALAPGTIDLFGACVDLDIRAGSEVLGVGAAYLTASGRSPLGAAYFFNLPVPPAEWPSVPRATE